MMSGDACFRMELTTGLVGATLAQREQRAWLRAHADTLRAVLAMDVSRSAD